MDPNHGSWSSRGGAATCHIWMSGSKHHHHHDVPARIPLAFAVPATLQTLSHSWSRHQHPSLQSTFVSSFSTIPKIVSTSWVTSYSSSSSSSSSSALCVLPPTAVLDASTVSPNYTSLWIFFLESIIANGVPALFTILIVAFVTRQIFRRNPNKYDNDDDWYEGNVVSELYNDLYGDGGSSDGSTSPLKNLRRLFRSNRKRGGSSGSGTTDALNFSNLGIPKEEYLKVTNWNRKLDSYQYSMTAATSSKAKAAANLRSRNFQRAIQRGIESTPSNNDHDKDPAVLSLTQQTALILAEREFLEQGQTIAAKLQSIQTQLTRGVIDDELYQNFNEMTPDVLDPDPNETTPVVVPSTSNKSHTTAMTTTTNANPSKTTTTTSTTSHHGNSLIRKLRHSSSGSDHSSSSRQYKRSNPSNSEQKEWIKLQQELLQLELNFVRDVISILGPERANGIRTALLGNVNGAAGTLLLQLQDRPLRTLLNLSSPDHVGDDDSHRIATIDSNHTNTITPQILSAANASDKRLYVTNFLGDVTASQVENLREEVTAMVRHARPGIDEALVVLQTGGGTVTGYGLAAAQLVRLKQHGIRLTIAAEQVAASGGYMMCCVADRIIASPFCVLGSIGVISDIPNVYDRLKQEGIEFQTVTAGRYKRTLTPTKKVTKEDIEKTKDDLEAILTLFRGFVTEYRPQLDIDKVATGATWFGTDALEKGLCDEIKTVDDVITDFMDRGYNVYELEYSPPAEAAELGRLLPFGNSDNASGSSLLRWIIQALAAELRSEFKNLVEDVKPGSESIQRKYMMLDDTFDKIRAKD